MKIVQGIPSKMIVSTAARRNKDYELEFINTDTNSDLYELKIFLRRYNQDDEQFYKIRLILTCTVLSYPALEMTWVFDDEEFELASRVYHRICDEVDDVKTDFDRSMAPSSILASKIKEAVKPISIAKQQKNNSVSLDESSRRAGVSDWRKSIYSNHYPNMSQKEKNKLQKFEGKQVDPIPHRKEYGTREKY